MLSLGKASKLTQTKKMCQLKSPQLIHHTVEIPATEETKHLLSCVTKEHGLFLNGRIVQYDRVDNHSRDMGTFLLNKNIIFIK